MGRVNDRILPIGIYIKGDTPEDRIYATSLVRDFRKGDIDFNYEENLFLGQASFETVLMIDGSIFSPGFFKRNRKDVLSFAKRISDSRRSYDSEVLREVA